MISSFSRPRKDQKIRHCLVWVLAQRKWSKIRCKRYWFIYNTSNNAVEAWGLRGTAVARLTPYQKVVSSNPTASLSFHFLFFLQFVLFLLVSYFRPPLAVCVSLQDACSCYFMVNFAMIMWLWLLQCVWLQIWGGGRGRCDTEHTK